IYVHVKAYGPGGQSYVVDADFLEGDTTDHRSGAFAKLEEYQRRIYKFEAGGSASALRFPIDAGFRTHVVYGYVRDHQQMGAMAVKGEDGWNKPSLGAPRAQDVNLDGKRIRKGVQLYNAGTWPMKGVHYSNLRKDMLDDGGFPFGYVHFTWGLPVEYFKQITGEYLAEETYLGRIRRVWKPIPGKENHWLDCTVYSDAVADGHLGLNTLDDDDWQALAAEYGVGLGSVMADEGLFTPPSVRMAKAKAAVSSDVDTNGAEDEKDDQPVRAGFTSSHGDLS
ncbi:MAG: terminase gpA endonuclease subunit, partial [Pseudomonadota bacterium]